MVKETPRIERVKNINNASRYSDEWNIWRMDLEEKMSMQMTVNGGKYTRVSADGIILYYSRSDTSGIFRSPIGGSFEKKTIEDFAPVDWNKWFVRDLFIIYVPRVAVIHPCLIRYSLETGETTLLIELQELVYFFGSDLSSDKNKVWYSQIPEQETDNRTFCGDELSNGAARQKKILPNRRRISFPSLGLQYRRHVVNVITQHWDKI